MDITTICSVCLACTALIIVLDVARNAAACAFRASDLLWALVALGAQVFVFSWSSQKLLTADEGSELMVSVLGVSAAGMVMAHLALSRRRIARGMRGISGEGETGAYRVASLPIDVLVVLVSAVFSVLALELPHNHDLTLVVPQTLFVEWALVATAATALYFIGQRRGFLAALVPLTCLGFGIAEYFVFLFKNQPLQPGDFLAAGTAATVADAYTYTLDAHCLWAIACALLAMTLLCLVSHTRLERTAGQAQEPCRPRPDAAEKKAFAPRLAADVKAALASRAGTASARPAGVLANLTVGLALVAALVSNVCGVDYRKEYGITVDPWGIWVSYTRQAYFPTFIASFQMMIPTAPEGYDPDSAVELINEYAAAYDEDPDLGASESRQAAAEQFDEERPCVVAIMNETFSDLSIFDWMDPSYEGPTFFNSLGDCLQRGVLYTSVNGGGTANSEFEFLTGNSMANFGAGVYPYNSYNLSHTDNLAGVFKELGYDTLAVHPCYPQNWNRANVYETFGFDRFLSIEDYFADSETYRTRVTDKATYDLILEELESGTTPEFILDVTMQNHSGYDTGLVPEDELVHYELADGHDDPTIDEYVASIAKSDAALEEFLTALSALDRKVVVVFFGDHQPYMTTTYNDAFEYDDGGDEHQQNIFQTKYIMWANYDVAGNDQESELVDLDASTLGSAFLHAIGAPLTDFQKARLKLRDALPVINAVGYEDAEGFWHLPSEASGVPWTNQVLADYETMEYYNMFGDGTDVFAQKMQDTANM